MSSTPAQPKVNIYEMVSDMNRRALANSREHDAKRALSDFTDQTVQEAKAALDATPGNEGLSQAVLVVLGAAPTYEALRESL